MMIRTIASLTLLIALFSWSSPAMAAEATFFGPLISPECNCEVDGTITAPDWGCVMQTVQNTINLTISLSVIIATLYIVYTGFMFVASAGNPRTREKAKARLMNVIVGMLVVLSAWLLVDFLMKSLYNPATEIQGTEFGPWNAILSSEGDDKCFKQSEGAPPLPGVTAVPGQTPSTSGGSNLGGTNGCPDCVSLSDKGMTCTNNCKADPRVADRLVTLKSNFSGTWVVTEAYPPSATHTNPCHNQGTCVDVAFRGTTTYTAENIRAFTLAAAGARFRAIFETRDCNFRDQLREQNVTAYCTSDRGYGGITGNHFSLYATAN